MCGDDWHTHTTIKKAFGVWWWSQRGHFSSGKHGDIFMEGNEPTWGLAMASAEYYASTHRRYREVSYEAGGSPAV